MRTDSALALLLGKLQRGAQLVQRVAAEHGADERAVGLQHAVDLRQDARQVVDPVHRHAAEDHVEGVWGEGKELVVLEHVAGQFEVGHVGCIQRGVVDVAVQERGGGFGGDELGDFGCERVGHWGFGFGVWVRAQQGAGDVAGVGAEVEDEGERAFDVLGGDGVSGLKNKVEAGWEVKAYQKTFAHAHGDFILEVIGLSTFFGIGCRSLLLQPFCAAVEDFKVETARLEGI